MSFFWKVWWFDDAKYTCFAVFEKNSKIQNGGPKKFFGEMGVVFNLDTLWVENFDEIALSRSIKEIAKFLCFAVFAKNSKIQNGRQQKIFRQIGIHTWFKYLWIENFDEIALSHSVKEIAKFLCFAFFTKNSKIQNGRTKKFFGVNWD